MTEISKERKSLSSGPKTLEELAKTQEEKIEEGTNAEETTGDETLIGMIEEIDTKIDDLGSEMTSNVTTVTEEVISPETVLLHDGNDPQDEEETLDLQDEEETLDPQDEETPDLHDEEILDPHDEEIPDLQETLDLQETPDLQETLNLHEEIPDLQETLDLQEIPGPQKEIPNLLHLEQILNLLPHLPENRLTKNNLFFSFHF